MRRLRFSQQLIKLVAVLFCVAVMLSTLSGCSETKANARLDLATGEIVSKDSAQPQGPAIWGMLKGQDFEPSHVVAFIEKADVPNTEWMPGWIELRTGKIHRDVEAVSPQQPYLKGRIDLQGNFHVEPGELNYPRLEGEGFGVSSIRN